MNTRLLTDKEVHRISVSDMTIPMSFEFCDMDVQGLYSLMISQHNTRITHLLCIFVKKINFIVKQSVYTHFI